jgi:hypothetical protein
MRVIIVFMLLCAAASVVAREPSVITKNSEGKEFWLCFMKNYKESSSSDKQNRSDGLRLQLFLTSSYDAEVVINVEEIGYENSVNIKANTVVNVQLPAATQLRMSESAERLAVHIVADTTIAVYGLNSRFQTTDTYMALPTTVLGTEYRAIGYTKLSNELLSQFSIIATEDETTVEITPYAATVGGRPAKRPYTVQLRRGDVYTVSARWESVGACDLTGSKITANKKIAVYSGHICAYVPPKVDACNHLVEQVPPVQAWGKHYYLGNLRERSKYTYRVVASEDSTKVFEDSRLVAVLKAGEFFETLNASKHLQITADRPVLVAQYAQGFKNGDSVGDPMMILVSPTQQFLNEYRFATPINGDWHHYINVVAPSTGIGGIRLNGKKIDSLQFVPLGESRYSIAQVAVPFGTHLIKGNEPFGLYSYGFGFKTQAYDAYGNMAGQSFFELSKVVDTLPPLADGKKNRDAYLLTFRDDRTTDRGMKVVRVLTAVSLEASIPKIEEGAPQVPIKIQPAISGRSGRIQFEATDVAGNTSSFTVCYVFDSQTNKFEYQLSDGLAVECASESSWFFGGHVSALQFDHEATFSSTPELPALGTFNESATQASVGFGGLIGKKFGSTLAALATLDLQLVGGSMLAPDTLQRRVFVEQNNAAVPLQEATVLCITSPLVLLGLQGEWYPQKFFYLTGGVRAGILLGSSVEVQQIILRPTTIEYPSGGRAQTVAPATLSTLTSFHFAGNVGLGFSYPVTFRASVNVEVTSTWYATSVLNNADWAMQTLGLHAGVRWRL